MNSVQIELEGEGVVKKRFILGRVAFVLLIILFFLVISTYLLTTSSTPPVKDESVTAFIDLSPTQEIRSSDWLSYSNITPYYTFTYPQFWTLLSSSPDGYENCGGPILFTQTTRSWMTVCPSDQTVSLDQYRAEWSQRADLRDRFIGGNIGFVFEYKPSQDRYEYYAVVENTSQFDLLEFHLTSDVGEREAVKAIFDKILNSVSFREAN